MTTRQQVSTVANLTYAVVDAHTLHADLYLPEAAQPAPVVIYVHGGGWAVGSRTDYAASRLSALAAMGLAVLSIDYRLVDAAHFPAQLHDVKAAIRWVRAHAGGLGVDARRVGIWGASAGAVLAALAGLTAGRREWEGNVGDHQEHSSDVDAVVFWFGISDLLSTTTRSPLETELLPDGPEAAFLGLPTRTDIAGDPHLARHASPLEWVHNNAPPFLIAHGDRDRIVPPSESLALHTALTRAGATSMLLTVGGAGHEDQAFDSTAHLAVTAAFLRSALHGDTVAANANSESSSSPDDVRTSR
jgi:acetyl esterase/lipase